MKDPRVVESLTGIRVSSSLVHSLGLVTYGSLPVSISKGLSLFRSNCWDRGIVVFCFSQMAGVSFGRSPECYLLSYLSSETLRIMRHSYVSRLVCLFASHRYCVYCLPVPRYRISIRCSLDRSLNFKMRSIVLPGPRTKMFNERFTSASGLSEIRDRAQHLL